MKKIIIIGIIAASGLALLFYRSNYTQRIRIAINIPLSGPVATVSGNYPKGFRMGIDEACIEFGVPRDVFELDIQDNVASPVTAVSVFNQQKIRGYDAYIVGTTEAASAVTPVLKDDALKPAFLFVYDAFMTTKNENLYRIFTSFKAEAPLWVRFAEKIKAKKVFVISLDMSGTEEEFSKLIIPSLTSKGISVERVRFSSATVNFREIVAKAKESKADAFFISGYSFHLDNAISAMHENNLIRKHNTMCSMDFADFTHLKNGQNGTKYNDIIFACPLFEIRKNETEEWCKRYRELYANEPTYIEAYAYDNARFLVYSYSKLGKISADVLLNLPKLKGIACDVTFDSDRDVLPSLSLAYLHNGVIQEW